jgi:serine-type D-Ala-D-Ala carboxypeptidase/endopeptidase (penicillin-binding protein 4)
MIKRNFLRMLLAATLLSVQGLAPAHFPVLASQTSAPAPQQPETVESLRARLAAHVSQPRYAAAVWGVKVVSLDTGVTVFEHNAGKYFSPASNAKLYSAALALARLGGDYRIKTSIYSTAPPAASGTIKGDLIVYGRGDPTMAARLAGGDYFKPFEPLALAIANAGVRRVEGDLVGDESFFKGPPFGSGWEWDDLQWYYGAEVSALTGNDNAVDLFVKPADRAGLPCRITTGPQTSLVTIMNRTETVAKGSESRITVYRPVGENIIYVSGRLAIGDRDYSGSVAVHDPARLFVTLLKQALAERGITVTGRVRTIDWKYREVTPLDLTKFVEVGAVESLPIKDIVRETLKPSQNLYAQLLLLQVGAQTQQGSGAGGQGLASGVQGNTQRNARTTSPEAIPGPRPPVPDPQQTTEEAAIEEMNKFLSEAGINKGDVVLEEGSGLSRKDLITPAATVELLKFMSRHRWGDAFRDSLPIAGVDGTLERRMKTTTAAGNLRAKTGTLRYVYTLSGYVTTASGERLAFSILLNNAHNMDRAASPRDDLDALAVMLAGFSGRTGGQAESGGERR